MLSQWQKKLSLFAFLITVVGITKAEGINRLPSDNVTNKVVSIDWTQTETLLALGITPVAVAQITDYNAWVKEPIIPPQVPDLGLRTQPNLERLYELSPDRVFISPMFSSLQPQLEKIAPVTNIGLYRDGKVDWTALTHFTRTMAKEVGYEVQAETLISDSEDQISTLKESLPPNVPPLLMIQFMDSHHVRVFGENSLYKTAINQLGLINAWKGKTNAWGFSLIGIDKLLGINGQIVIIEPFPAGTRKHLDNNEFWQYAVQETGYPVLTVPAVWSFGTIPSATRFARFIAREVHRGEAQ